MSHAAPANALRKTALNAAHHSLGGTMVDFGGWEMPLWYPTGAVREHMAVLTGAGLFDTGHMSVLLAEGASPRSFLNYAVTKDISGLRMERAAYGVILDASGFAVDDVIIYPLAEDRFALVVNAGMADTVISHMRALPGGDAVRWTDLTGICGKIDIQGPAAFSIIKPLVADADALFASCPYFSFQGDFDFTATKVRLTDGTPLLLSRTGYTGEQGFELFLPADKAVHLWESLLREGAPAGLIPCGLAARDSLRAGAVLPLSHQDIGAWPFINTPWSFALPLAENGAFTKNFHGRAALDPEKAEHTLAFVGYDPRKVDTQEATVCREGREIGTVLTAVAEMAIGRVEGKIVGLNSPDRPEGWNPRGLVCGFVKVRERLQAGCIVTLKDSRREISVEICADIRPGRSARKPLR